MNQIQVAIAPIGWTNDDLPELGGEITFEQCVSEMALSGYTGCEVGNKFPRDTDLLKYHLDMRGLQICNQWFSFELTNKPLDYNLRNFTKHLDFLETMGAKVAGGGEVGTSCQGDMSVGVFEGRGRLTTELEWLDFAQKLNACGKLAADRGLKLSLHHHMGTVVQTLDDTLRLLELTDPRYVWLNYDTGHFYFAGDDPAVALQKTISRVAHVHLKDIRPKVLQQVHDEKMSFLHAVKSGVFTVPGDPEGCIDFAPIFKLLKEKYEGWVVVEAEQDPAKANPLEYAFNARQFIEDNLGV